MSCRITGLCSSATKYKRLDRIRSFSASSRSSCNYLIRAPEGKVVNITFTQFLLEESDSCSFDWLKILDGPDAAARQMGTFCGSELPGTNGSIASTRETVYLMFRSDSSFAHHGFVLNWTATEPVCGGVVRDRAHGSIATPGYPEKYPLNRDCSWTIYAELGKRIQFHFATLRIENHPNCSFDYVEV